MRAKAQPRQIIFCSWCMGEFSIRPSQRRERNFCKPECWHEWMSHSRIKDENPNWRADKASSNSKRMRARRWFTVGSCEMCGSTRAERHHVDGDPGNNSSNNIAILCRRCHMQVDGRLVALNKRNRGIGQRTDQ